jgi:deazaflavin-dependent oxidoreductase (nitroreductase family)
MQTLLVVLGAIVAVVAVIGVVFVVGMRRRWPFVIQGVRRLSTVTNRIVMRSAGSAGSPNSVVAHVGRRSGRDYRTPVVTARTDDGFAIALPYGPDTDWLKNVLAAGGAVVRVDGEEHAVERPEVVDIDEANHWFATKEQRMHRQFGVPLALLVTSR